MSKINYSFYDYKDIYNDGNIEHDLLLYYQNNKKIDVEDEKYFFYTTKIRENIVNWYPFKKGSNILEIGAGLGSITGALLGEADRVIAVEGSKRRCEVLCSRHKDADNLEIYCGNFNDMKFSQKFDYVVLIGVFEYAGLFFDSSQPFDNFIDKIKKLLTPDGKILLAIENKLGIKYFDGYSEDHCKRPYVGLENYKNETVRTFGKSELKKMFESHDMKCNFFGVFPDYKLPSFIFNENYNISNTDLVHYDNYNYYEDNILFDEKEALKVLNDNDLSIDFANSFFVEITKNEKLFCDVDFAKFQNTRRDEYQVLTILSKGKVEKKPLTYEASIHLDKMLQLCQNLNKLKIKHCKIEKKDNRYYIEKVRGSHLLEDVGRMINDNNIIGIENLLDDFFNYLVINSKEEKPINLLHESLKCFGDKVRVLPYALLDLHFDNIFSTDNGFVLIDQEWWDDRQLPIEYNVYVNLNILYFNYPELNKFHSIYYFYDKYNFTDDKLDAFVKTNKFFFFEYKNFINKNVEKLLKEKSYACSFRDKLNSLNEQNDMNKELVSFYKNKFEQSNKLVKDYEKLILEKNSKIFELVTLTGSRPYKLSLIFSKIFNKLFPYNSVRRRFASKVYRFIRRILKFILNILRAICKFLYSIFPFEKLKRKILHRIKSNRYFSRIFGVSFLDSAKINRTLISNNSIFPIYNLDQYDGKIAVHLHLYYLDLAREFYNYLLNVPYEFDLYISIPFISSKSKKYFLKKMFKKIPNVRKIVIKESMNCGRDYGPMFVLFGNELKKYDYLLHIHSKKSLRTGSEQSNWRRYLLDNLIGSPELVMQYFYLMSNYNVGIAYPDTYSGCSYISHTYLGVKGLADVFYKKLGLELKDSYLNFSAGSMYWCKVELLEDIFNLNLTWDDFGEEHGQDDGTLEYVLERIYDPLLKKKNLNYATFNIKDNCFHLNDSVKSLDQYYCIKKENLFSNLDSYNVVSFDIFDTLVTRKVYDPDDIFKIIDYIVVDKYHTVSGYYINLRKKSEYEFRKSRNFVGDCTIDDIYLQMSNSSILSANDLEDIKKIEIEIDLNSIIPRKDMLDIYNKLLQKNKQIILISDMYYPKSIIEKILSNCGYYNYYELLVSSEIGFRKDNGTMWDYVCEKYNKFIHVGDNEESDIHALMLRQKPYQHVLQGRKMYELSEMYNVSQNNIENSVMKGLIVNKILFNSPFSLNTSYDKVLIHDLYSYGYAILAPIFMYFFEWLNKTFSNDVEFLFISREGYYLQKIFKHFFANSSCKEINNCYFLTSRKVASISNIHTLDDVKKIFSTGYNGSLYELFYHRLGLVLNKKYQNKLITLPNDLDFVMSVVQDNFDDILLISNQMRENYLDYIKSVVDFSIDKEYVVVDIGYSGSVQYELSKLLNRKISGAYFITSNNLKPISIGAKVYSCFNSIDYDDSFDNSPISCFSVILESFLTAPVGQLQGFENGKPLYMSENNKNELIKNLDEIFNGICGFITDMSEMNVKDIAFLDLDKEYILNNFLKYMTSGKIDSNIKKTFKVEDFYCSNGDIKF